MELKSVIEARTSIRSFKNEAVKLKDIREMVRLAGLAPSVNNFQPWRYIAIFNKDMLNQMTRIIASKIDAVPSNKSIVAANVKKQVTWYSTFFNEAPVVLALIMKPYDTIMEGGMEISHEEINAMRNYPDIQSAGASIQNLLLAAVDLGYGACWLSGPMIAREEIEQILHIKAPEKLLAFVAVGKPAKNMLPKDKPDLASSLEVLE